MCTQADYCNHHLTNSSRPSQLGLPLITSSSTKDQLSNFRKSNLQPQFVMDSTSSDKQAPLPLPLATVDEAILKSLNIPPPEHHFDNLTGENIVKLYPPTKIQGSSSYKKPSLIPLVMATYEFHQSLMRLIDRETKKDPAASIVAIFKESRLSLVGPIRKPLQKRYDDFLGVLTVKKLRAREASLRSQLIHAPEDLTPADYAEAIAALQKVITGPKRPAAYGDKAYKASLKRVLAREKLSSRMDSVTLESPALANPNARKHNNAIDIGAEEETPHARKRSKTIPTNPEEELEIALFGSLDSDLSDYDKNEDNHKPIMKPKTPSRLPPLLLPQTPGLSEPIKSLKIQDPKHR